MCGIAGIIGVNANTTNISILLETQKHRGPDHSDFYCDEKKVA